MGRRFALGLAVALIFTFVGSGVAMATTSLGSGASPSSAWQKDPDSMVDPAKVVTSQILPAPDVTIGDLDTTVAGVGDVAVGVGDALLVLPVDPLSSGTTFWVDNTPFDGDCPQATFISIQAAVTASGPNDIVKVCPGTYSERVQIIGPTHDGLRLESLTPLGATIQWPPDVSANHQLIDVNGANHVTIRGFAIRGPFNSEGCSPDRHEGVLFEQAFDGRLDHNHVTLIRDVEPTLWGCQQGDAVAVGRRLSDPTLTGMPASARIDHNLIDRYQKNGVQAVNPGTFANIDHNTITYFPDETSFIPYRAAPNGVVVFRNAAATVEQNAISGNRWTTPLSTGIILDESPMGSSEVDHNIVSSNDFGIETDTQTELDISHNSVFDSVSDAITLCGETSFGCGPAEQIVVRANDIHNNGGSGIALFGADSNLLKSNHIQDNGVSVDDTTDGIRVDAGSMNNQILENHLSANIKHDCHDDSTGTGTALTDNTWTNDRADTQSRDGLCKFATTT